MASIEVKGMTVGVGEPKTIVSLMGGAEADLLGQVERGLAAGTDWFEYRADFARDPADARAIALMARRLAQALPGNPLLFTFRTKAQGGQVDLPAEDLEALCRSVIEDGAVDAVDVESWLGDETVRSLCSAAHGAGIVAVVSFHDFGGTPPQDDMVQMLLHFAELGADIPKIAVMAQSAADVVSLLAATERVSSTGKTGPLLTMAMGPQGSISRLAGETFGSALTFCSLDRASAPGQVGIAQAKDIMSQLHEISIRQDRDEGQD